MNREKSEKIQALAKKFQDEFEKLMKDEENYGFVMTYQHEIDEDNSTKSMVSVYGRKSDVLFALAILENKTGLVTECARLHAQVVRQMAMEKLRNAPDSDTSDGDTSN